MRNAKGFSLMLLSFIVPGCASVQPFYTDIPTGNHELVDFEGELRAEQVQGVSLEDLLLLRAADDYELVGRADFNAPSQQDWTGAMVRKGRSIKAEKVDYYTWYDRTDTGTGVLSMPTTQTSVGTVWGPVGPRTVTMTSTSSTFVPYSYSVARNEYHVFYFKKRKNPMSLGVYLDCPNDEISKKVGTHSALLVVGVVPRKLAWKNDVFKGDVILEISGNPATFEELRKIGASFVGTKFKIWRDGKIMEKVLETK